jgi:hypothetical protein
VKDTSVGAAAVPEILTGTTAEMLTFAVAKDWPEKPETPVVAVVAVAFFDRVAVAPLTPITIVSTGMPGPVIAVPGAGNTFAVFTASVGLLIVVAAVKEAAVVDVAVAGWDSVTMFLETAVTVVLSGMPAPATTVPTTGKGVKVVSCTDAESLNTYPFTSTVEIDDAEAALERVTELAVAAVTMVPS